MTVLHMLSTTVTIGLLAFSVGYIVQALHADADRIRAALAYRPIPKRRPNGHAG